MTDLKSVLNMIVSELTPGAILSLGLIMLIDNLSNRAVSSMAINANIFILILAITSIINGILLLNISYFLIDPAARRLLKTKSLSDYWLITIRTFCFNMIIPLMLIGFVFPRYISCEYLQPYFLCVMILLAIVFFVFGLLQERINGTYYSGH